MSRQRSKPSPPSGPREGQPLGPLVVGLGASAGGIEAFEGFLSHLPARPGLVFVIVQHLESRHPSMLVELLARHTKMPVAEAAEGVQAEPNHVYVIAPGTLLTIENGVLRVAAAAPTTRASIDTFFRSLAEDQGERAVGILFSGAGHDGTVGLRAIKARGGLTLAQSPETARHDSMPQSAIAAGLVDHVLPVAEMPAKVLEHAAFVAAAADAGAAPLDAQIEGSLDRICALIHQHTGHDFGRYKPGTLVRRIRRRIQIQHLESVDQYVQLLEKAEGEPEGLLKDLLIGVTQFFRDPEAFQALAQQVVPRIVQGKAADGPIRIWVPGCASGEEAYSIAILVLEHLERLGARRFVQIFATDLDAELLREARVGRYPRSISEHVSAERLARFFVREGQKYQAAKELREMCIFSEHSLIRDPPFSQLDVVSCRNVLIYLSSELQKRLVPLFHYALRPGGFLFLGPSEGIAGTPELFETLDKRSRIFRRKETVTRPVVEFPLVGRSPARAAIAAAASVPEPREPAPPTVQERIAAAFERTLREEYTFPSAVINERGDALFVAGPVSRYLQMPAGPVAMPNLFEAFRGGLRHELRTALRAARTRQRKIVRDDIAVDVDDSIRTVRLIVRPLPAIDPEEGLYLVVIQEGAPATGLADPETEHGATEQPAMEQLENELRSTRAELKTTVEEVESANEQLKSSNEELISTNEELQSANEELQTSKEELQSLNEELETVNTELRQKVDELGTANSDLQNLFAATEIATIFLDRSLRVARFTPAATELFHLIDADVGRPLADLAPRFAGQDLVSDAREVLRLLAPVERPVLSPDGTLFVLRVLPYRTVENVIAGVVITFVNVSEVKRAEQAARQQAQLVHLSHDAIMVWPLDGPIESWNRGAQDLYGYSAEEAVGRVSYDLLATVFSRPRTEIEAELRHGGCWVGELQQRTKEGRAVTVLSNLQLARGEDGVDRVLEADRDITERKGAERRLAYLASFPENNLNPIVEADVEARVRYANPAAARLFPDLAAQGAAHPWLVNWQTTVDQLRTGAGGDTNARTVVVDDRTYHQTLYYLADEGVVRTYGLDITALKLAELQVRESEERFRTLATNAPDVIARFDREGRYVYANPVVSRQVGLPAEAIIGKTAEALGRNVGTEAWESRLGEVFDTGKPLRFDRRTLEGRWFDVQMIPEFRGADVETVLAIARDVTERRRAEEALKESEAKLRDANARLLEVDRRKNEFLAVLSHELRNPLTPIRYSLNILERAVPGSEPARRAQGVIDRQTGQLVRLVDDLLDVTRVSRNKIQLQRRQLDLSDLVRRTVEDHRSLLEGKGITVKTTFPSEPLPIDGDEARLAQVVGNLLQNAAKFTPVGGRVSVATRMTASKTRAALRVLDTGAGIDPEMLRRLFQPFMQADMTLDRSTGGLGLGLALVKGLVEMHGGEVCAHSDGPDKGAEFVVELPLAVAAIAEARAKPAAPGKGRRVLIIEDNIDAADSLCEVLRFQDHVVEVAYSGPEGLARAREFKPDVVLCDIGLPGMDGFEVARMFRRDESLRGIALIALSGYALPEDLQRAAEAGFRSHLAKPASPEKLEQVLASLDPPRS